MKKKKLRKKIAKLEQKLEDMTESRDEAVNDVRIMLGDNFLDQSGVKMRYQMLDDFSGMVWNGSPSPGFTQAKCITCGTDLGYACWIGTQNLCGVCNDPNKNITEL